MKGFLREKLLYIVGAAVLASLIISGILLTTKPACQEQYRSDVTVKIGDHTLVTQRAQSEAQQEQGLGGRSCIGANQAMLFVFNKPGYYPIWMKGMKFPIDIVWLSSNKQVTDIKSSVQPNTYPQSFTNSAPAKYVLELGAGAAANYNIQTGSQINF